MSAVVAAPVNNEVTANGQIHCQICNAKIHAVHMHLKTDHAEWTLDKYKAEYPGAVLFSPEALLRLEQMKKKKAEEAAAAAGPTVGTVAPSVIAYTPTVAAKAPFHELFHLPKGPATLSRSGREIMVSHYNPRPEDLDLIPKVDDSYVFNIDILKTMLMGMEMRIPVYLWGHSGTGKTTVFEQIAAYTRHPLFRVQHTANMEEEHIVGGWRLRDGRTHFELGPLGMAMKHGWIYMCDEYDFGRPEVTSVYQAVLEGKPLIIKEADPENRVIRPHPDFRIVATGNTNGQGDESGLYAGTNIQNTANYERFGIVEQMHYMDKDLEIRLVSQQANIPVKDATKLVDYAARIREQFASGQLGNPISPRSLIYAAKLGIAKSDYKAGLNLSFVNRLSATDREAAKQLANRVFG